MTERGGKPHKTVWLCQTQIPHGNGAEERYISGVYASRDRAALAGLDSTKEEE